MRTLALGLTIAMLAGCHIGGGTGSGNGNVTFWFANCGETCKPEDHPVAAGGAHTTINVTGAKFTTVRSSNPSVATFTNNNQSVEVISGSPGTTSLELLDGGNRIIASAEVSVEATARLAVDHGWKSGEPLVLEGQQMVFHVTTLDAQGRTTKGSGAVAFALGGTLARAVLPLSGDAIGFVGTPGAGSIAASCPETTVTQPFTIVGLAEITAITMSAQTLPDDTAIVSVVPQSALGAVYGGPCDWQTSDPSVTLATDVGPALHLGPGTVSVFNLTRPGTFTLSCTLAGQTAMVTVTR
ncbi:MAG: hypothetical protein JWN44_6181 [Myxococcales bacterium]|nr:hypothetical protein [Myxococcales bacterium]